MEVSWKLEKLVTIALITLNRLEKAVATFEGTATHAASGGSGGIGDISPRSFGPRGTGWGGRRWLTTTQFSRERRGVIISMACATSCWH